jgi:phage shock protein E
MPRTRILLIITAISLLFASVAIAQYPVISAQDVKTRMSGKKKALLVDTRTPEEYREGHISGAVNIPADQIKAEAKLLPKDKTAPIIFYCRGAG